MAKSENLQTTKSTTSLAGKTCEIKQVETTRDLLTTKPMMLQVEAYGEKEVLKHISAAVQKCLYRLDIEMDEGRLSILCQDILEVYGYDSIEDISTCLKRAGQGKYGFGFNKRGVITMVMVAEWMGRLLEEKATEREKIITKRKAKRNLEEDMEEDKEMTPEARKYLQKIKDIIQESLDREPVRQSVFDHKSDLWIKELKKDRGHRLVFRFVMAKIEAGKELSERELDWLEKWNIKIPG